MSICVSNPWVFRKLICCGLFSAKINECVFTNGISDKVFTSGSVATVLTCKSAEILTLQGCLCGLTISTFLGSLNLQRAYRVILESVCAKTIGEKRW